MSACLKERERERESLKEKGEFFLLRSAETVLLTRLIVICAYKSFGNKRNLNHRTTCFPARQTDARDCGFSSRNECHESGFTLTCRGMSEDKIFVIQGIN